MPDSPLNRVTKYWWVSQNQTFEQEFEGGYLWSPRRNSNGGYNHAYENMRDMAPGDVVFSFVDRRIKAISIVRYCAVPSPKPEEFGDIGPHWHPKLGWMVAVDYKLLNNAIEPRSHMPILGPLQPAHYAPLQVNGDGNQAYLFEVPKEMAQVIIGLIGQEAKEFSLNSFAAADTAATIIDDSRAIVNWENAEQKKIEIDSHITNTVRVSLTNARIGQGLFKQRVMRIEKACRITKVSNPEHLIGSHIRPWRESDNDQRLDGENGLLLTPTIDHLFDRGFISFENTGSLIISPVADRYSLDKMKIPEAGFYAGTFSAQQKQYLDFHRDMVLLKRTH
ncbi:MAG: HNH endonuclease signature motif containing protein [Elusimicrobiota bacterium]|nr:HNH endonuclease signature motif containing protein [Elusimicrobiota bacterium]